MINSEEILRTYQRKLLWYKFLNIIYNLLCLSSIFFLFYNMGTPIYFWLYLFVSAYWVFRIYIMSKTIKILSETVFLMKSIYEMINEIISNNAKIIELKKNMEIKNIKD